MDTDSLKRYLEEIKRVFGLYLNKNQEREISRLIYELIKGKKKNLSWLISTIQKELEGKNPSGKDRFNHIKKILVYLRYPISALQNLDLRTLYLNKVKPPLKNVYHPSGEFKPLRIIVEEEARGSELEESFREKFPSTPLSYIERYCLFLKNFKLTPANLKKPLVFIIKEKWDFIKRCPCTKNHLSCGYWIFNLGFGCYFDCSYCYLQQYQNFPGLILPSNIEDFFLKFEDFLKKIPLPVRIGTGEFCDSLALDDITGYSLKLIKYFRKKPLLFELKTKSANIENLLKIEPAPNVIISWSVNPQKLIESEEFGTANLLTRLKKARILQEKKFKIAFHFDPIIYIENWTEEYKGLIEAIYGELKPPFAWISLGTLRFNRHLKSIIEERFPRSRIIYGELFMGRDKKLRYPEFLREKIYKNMIKWIRKHDKRTPVYLCMEEKEIWQRTLLKEPSPQKIERYLLRANEQKH